MFKIISTYICWKKKYKMQRLEVSGTTHLWVVRLQTVKKPAHPVYELWLIQEPNKLALWNKLHFEEKKTENIEHVYNIQYLYLLNKYIKWNVWRLALRYDPYMGS